MENRQTQISPVQAIDMNRVIETGTSIAFDLNRCDFMVQGMMLFIVPKRQNIAAHLTQFGNVYQLPPPMAAPVAQPTAPVEDEKPQRGRPKGSRNKKKKVTAKRPGRPPGSKNKPKAVAKSATPEATAEVKQEAPPVEAKPVPQTVTHEAITLEKLPPEPEAK